VTVCADQPPRELEKGRHTLNGLKWVHHDGIGYVLLEPATATVCAQTQSGNWHQVHSRESARTVERDVFSLWIDHGSKPRGVRYAYIVLPDVDVSAMPSLCNSLPVTILEQTASRIAISSQDTKLVQAVFFEPGRLAWGNGSSVEVEAPCLVTLDSTAEITRVYVADPTHTRKAVTLQLSGRYAGHEARYDKSKSQTKLTISLPQEGSAGRTVGLELRPAKLREIN
jgi:chondroitin AC lyase